LLSRILTLSFVCVSVQRFLSFTIVLSVLPHSTHTHITYLLKDSRFVSLSLALLSTLDLEINRIHSVTQNPLSSASISFTSFQVDPWPLTTYYFFNIITFYTTNSSEASLLYSTSPGIIYVHRVDISSKQPYCIKFIRAFD
jgi:hypothetical protein